jgi:F0F1-type ATP synthase alpha subunit
MLREISTEDIHRFEEELFEYLVAEESIAAEIRETGVLSPECSEKLSEAIKHCKEKFLNKV